VSRLGLGGRVFDKDLTGAGTDPGTPLAWMIINSAVNSTASLEQRNGKMVTIGNTTEGALLSWLNSGGWFQTASISYLELRTKNPVLYQIHFSSDRKRMTSVASVDGRPAALVKGAP